MANPDPKNPTPMQPDPQSDRFIPVAALHFPAGFKLGLPGKRGVHNSVSATKPGTGEYWSIVFDLKLHHHTVAHFKPGPDMKRPPADTLNIPENMCTWRRL